MTSIYETALKHIIERTVNEDLFSLIWHLLYRWPSAVSFAELLSVHDNMALEQEEEVLGSDCEVRSLMLSDLQEVVASASSQIAAFGLEIVQVEQFGYKVKEKHETLSR